MPRTLTSPEALAVRAWLSGSDGGDDLSSWARVMLAEIRSGFRIPAAIRHPLGFICVKLYRSTKWGLCMHIWDSPLTPPNLITTSIHAHSWDLFSQVVCGWLENIEVCVVDGSPLPTHRVLKITSTSDADLVHATQRLVCWTRNESTHVEAGRNYTLTAGTFHVSRPSTAGLTATLLLAENRGSAPELALGRLDCCDHIVVRQSYPFHDLQHIADVTLRNLVADRPADKLHDLNDRGS